MLNGEEFDTVNALSLNLWILAGVSLLCWLLSFPTKDNSWVDRIWSIVPAVYAWVWAGGEGFANARLNLISVLITLWAARLTFNFARKGGYRPGGEDYRWEVLREQMKPWQFQIFNLLFIVVFQNVLLYLIVWPLAALAPVGTGLDWRDLLLALLFLGLLTMETVADQQQWNFHQWKKSEVASGRKPEPGFLTTGLFRISRHPNFFAEVSQWWVVLLFASVQVGLASWDWLGAVILTALFIGSTRFTETISAGKYPAYREYQKSVSPLIPWFPKRG